MPSHMAAMWLHPVSKRYPLRKPVAANVATWTYTYSNYSDTEQHPVAGLPLPRVCRVPAGCCSMPVRPVWRCRGSSRLQSSTLSAVEERQTASLAPERIFR